MSIAENLNRIKATIPKEVALVAVSKTKSAEEIMQAYRAGHRVFGENRIQEMVEKWETLPKDIEWHMIGHVQRNKVKYMAPFVHLIHGVDSLKLLREINKHGEKNHRKLRCLLQVHIAEESSKFGFSDDEILNLVDTDEIQKLDHVEVMGLMGMATFTDDIEQVRKEFKRLKQLFRQIQTALPQLEVLSMGMSGDYEVAIEEGSTMVRIGSSIFGARN